ncbi:hypothetical protein GobsT_53410 [Gemmata obscuriglobus]|uniref:Uncharacterized protein n=1 Tax=Gemmata obscuriglobus TaxID=114 RepID=A0A2Z3H730_9BACT|nr:hypothetical protein [Gemmata obscuriglobus]AWM36800.1 hypothetical protein C1280_07055 [Gemmata obscuriglobus]QEG30536.1 hypothetical protein GobsT_53410 [Gemmata obscuriglobus]VTS09860.1 unnamed protein product [Gemmata obscuriglobus UQM 2246]
MPAELIDRLGSLQPVITPVATEPAFAARARLVCLRDALARTASQLTPARWNEPAVFFFDPQRQAELELARGPAPDRFGALTAHICAELTELIESVEVRRVARTIDGLHQASRDLALHCPAAGDLADLLAVPDDEVFLALAPAARTGVRLHVRGAATVGQFHELLAPTQHDGFQLFAPNALRADCTLPGGLTGCGHWLWPNQPLSVVPRAGGERIVLVGPAVLAPVAAEPRFSGLRAVADMVHVLNPFQVTDALSRLAGRPVAGSRMPDVFPVVRAA